MIWVIQQFVGGQWIDARDQYHQPLWFLTKREATRIMAALSGSGTYRIIRVKD